MRFLHTADLHLGKIFHEYSLLEDQRYMLDQLAEILEDPAYRALLIAGDVYDRAIPQTGAVNLFSGFLGGLKKRRPDLAILILPGNHDSASRLGFGRELLGELGVHLVTRPEDAVMPILVSANGGTSGSLDSEFRGGTGESCAFFLLPFLTPGSLRAELTGPEESAGEPIRSQAALAEEASARLEKAGAAIGADYRVLGAHLFIAGGLESESERVFLGTAERVRPGLFPGFDYTGLGHLHRFQQAGDNAWYAGSPLAYSFEEAKYEKVFLSVELKKNAPPGITPIPVKPQRKLQSLQGDFNYFFGSRDDPVLTEAAENYLEITLTGKELTENPLALLRSRFPFILSIKQEAARLFFSGESSVPGIAAEDGGRRGTDQDFEDFIRDLYGQGDDAKTALVRELLREIEAPEAES